MDLNLVTTRSNPQNELLGLRKMGQMPSISPKATIIMAFVFSPHVGKMPRWTTDIPRETSLPGASMKPR